MQSPVHCVAYRRGKPLGELALDAISDALAEKDTFVWVGLEEPDDALLSKMQEEFGLHELAIEDARYAHQRPKLETYGESIFIVLKTADAANGKVDYGETHLFAGRNFLVSVRHGGSVTYATVRERCEQTESMLAKGPGYALYALIDFIVDRYQPVVEQFEKEFDTLEEGVFKDRFDRLMIGRIYELKRQLLELRNAALPVADICGGLMHLHEELIPKDLRAYFRDIQDHVAHVVGTIDNIREMLTSAMQMNLALVSVQQNEVVKRLAGWGAMLAIPTVIFSLYGMNFKNMPELNWTYGYPVTIAVTVASCAFVYRRLRKAGWI